MHTREERERREREGEGRGNHLERKLFSPERAAAAAAANFWEGASKDLSNIRRNIFLSIDYLFLFHV